MWISELNVSSWAAIAGIVITVLLYSGNIKRERSAEKELARRVHNEIINDLARLIAHDDIDPDIEIIQSLIDSKTREYEIDKDMLPSIQKMFNDILTLYLENEFIPEATKKNLLDKIGSAKTKVLEDLEARIPKKEETFEDYFLILRSTLIAALGGLLVIYVLVVVSKAAYNEVIYPIIILLTSFFMVMITFFLRHFKSRAEEDYSSRIEFEDMIIEGLAEHFKLKPHVKFEDKVLDFIIETDSDKFLGEIKYNIDKEELIKISKMLERFGVNQGLVVTYSQVPDDVKKTARENRIVLLDGIQSPAELRYGLKRVGLIV